MIQLKPFTFCDFRCPVCGSKRSRTNEVLIPGLHALADNVCLECGFQYLQLLPVGHTVTFPISFGKENAVIYDSQNTWVTKGLARYFEAPGDDQIVIRKVVHKVCTRVVLLNALDFLYGHTLLKLLNCQYHLDEDPELGLIVMIPQNFEWLIPDGCAEVWVVEVPLCRLYYRHAAIQEFVNRQLNRFDSVFLSRAYTHPDFGLVDIRRFTGIAPFDLTMFTSKPFQITFVLREDRFWIQHKVFYLFFKILRRAGYAKAGVRLLAFMQEAMVERTIQMIKQRFPATKFVVAGIGRIGGIEGATDKRAIQVTKEVERDWCTTYADSHLVVGIHGSNMILPTAHAAGCVEILPDDRLPNIVQDVAVRYSDRRQLFLYRFVGEFAKPRSVAAHAISIFEGYETFNQNMCRNQYTVVDDEDSMSA